MIQHRMEKFIKRKFQILILKYLHQVNQISQILVLFGILEIWNQMKFVHLLIM